MYFREKRNYVSVLYPSPHMHSNPSTKSKHFSLFGEHV